MDYKEKIKERLDLLSPDLRSFVLNENWRRNAENIGKKFNLGDGKYASLENEIFFILLCFEPKSDFVENIKRELKIDSNMAGWIAEDINKNIFSQVEKEIDQMWTEESIDKEGVSEQSEIKSTNNIGNSFEQIILNQARAMQPAREEGSSSQQPVASIKEEEKPKVIHNYIGNEDPYREPLDSSQ